MTLSYSTKIDPILAERKVWITCSNTCKPHILYRKRKDICCISVFWPLCNERDELQPVFSLLYPRKVIPLSHFLRSLWLGHSVLWWSLSYPSGAPQLVWFSTRQDIKCWTLKMQLLNNWNTEYWMFLHLQMQIYLIHLLQFFYDKL